MKSIREREEPLKILSGEVLAYVNYSSKRKEIGLRKFTTGCFILTRTTWQVFYLSHATFSVFFCSLIFFFFLSTVVNWITSFICLSYDPDAFYECVCVEERIAIIHTKNKIIQWSCSFNSQFECCLIYGFYCCFNFWIFRNPAIKYNNKFEQPRVRFSFHQLPALYYNLWFKEWSDSQIKHLCLKYTNYKLTYVCACVRVSSVELTDLTTEVNPMR